MRHSMSKDTAFNAETTPRHTFLCSDSQCLPPGDPRILCAKHGYPITGKSFIAHARAHHIPVGDVKLVCLALWREREYSTFISIRFVAFSNWNLADYRS